MFGLFRKAALGSALIASAALAAAPAEARDRYYRGHRGGDDAAIAIAAGVAGLAIGAALASDGRRDRYYYDDGYYPRYRGGYYYPRSYYYRSYPRGYYYDGYRGDRYRDHYRYERKHRKWPRRHGRWND